MKKYIKYGVYAILVLIIVLTVFMIYKKSQKEELKINADTMVVNIFTKDINRDSFNKAISSAKFWNRHSNEMRNRKFAPDNETNLGKEFMVYFDIKYDNSLREKIEKVSYELHVTEELDKNWIMQSQCDETPFNTFLNEDNREYGMSRILMDGFMYNLSEDALLKQLNKSVIILHIQYKSGKIVDKTVKFNNIKITCNKMDGKRKKGYFNESVLHDILEVK